MDQAGDGIFQGLFHADTDLVKTCFAPYFTGCLRIFDSLKPKEAGFYHHTESDLLFASAPVFDLDISGYALLLSQLQTHLGFGNP